MGRGKTIFLALIGINLVYACVSIFTKWTSTQDILSLGYFLGLAGAVVVMGIYALLWQQIIKRIPLSDAYMFKGTSLVFILLLSFLLFDEGITWTNIVGSIIIISGIALFAKS